MEGVVEMEEIRSDEATVHLLRGQEGRSIKGVGDSKLMANAECKGEVVMFV